MPDNNNNRIDIYKQLATQDTKLDHLTEMLDELIQDSKKTHDDTIRNTLSLSWVKKGLYGLYCIVTGLAVWMLRSVFISN